MVKGSGSISRLIGERRISPIVILAALLLGLGLLAGCGGDDGDAGDGAEQTAEQEPAEEQPTDEEPADEQPGGEEPSDEPADGGAGDAAAGEQIFAAECSTCHGPDGGGGSAPSLQGRQDLADDRSSVVEQVTNGGGGMPAFEGQLSEQEINDVASYVSGQIASQ